MQILKRWKALHFFYCCFEKWNTFLSLQGISNEAGVGDKSKWLISESVQNVCNILIQILQKKIIFLSMKLSLGFSYLSE